MLFMVIERFKNRDAKAVYWRFRDRGRQLPDGLRYLDSWLAADLACCFQLVECDDPRLLQAWAAAWEDLIAFEFRPVVPSKEAYATLEPLL